MLRNEQSTDMPLIPFMLVSYTRGQYTPPCFLSLSTARRKTADISLYVTVFFPADVYLACNRMPRRCLLMTG